MRTHNTPRLCAGPQTAGTPIKFWNVASIGDDEGEITLYGDVVSRQPVDWWTGEPEPGLYIAPESFMEDLAAVKGKSNITIKINSCGGDLYTGIAIHNAIRGLTGHKVVVVEGIAASAASVIACAGDEVYVEGTDYAVDYNFTKGTVIITSLKDDAQLAGSLTASFSEVDDSEIADSDIIGGVTSSGEYSGLSAIALLYPEQFAVCNLIAAPGWSHSPAVYNAMLTTCKKINGHWDAFVVADLPLVDSTAQAVDTITKAIAWKKANAFTGERSKVYWPQAVDNLGNVFHLSTLAVVELMRADFSHNSVPMETCGNKAIPVIKQYFGANAKNRGFDQQSGKELTQNGISTAVAWGGEWVLWGDHTAAYTYGADVDPRAIFDVSMRMLMHITNDFQREWSPEIDDPMTRALKDRIINREQEKLDGYVSMGALLGSPVILFLESENSTTDVMNGDFRWDIAVTPTPPLKSASVYVAYTDAGFSVYYEGGDE